MTPEATSAGIAPPRVRDLHRKLLERALLRSDTQNIKDVFRRYDRGRAGVLTTEQFRLLMRDLDFVEADTDLLLRHLSSKDQSTVSFHAFMGDVQLGTKQNYTSKHASSGTSVKKVQQLSHLGKKTIAQSPIKRKGKDEARVTSVKTSAQGVQDPMEIIRTKLCQRILGHNKSIREVFVEHDVDGNGCLDHEEFGRLMAKYEFSLDEAQTIVDYLDKDSSGTIDYDEFAAGLLLYRPRVVMPVAPVLAPLSLTNENDKVVPRKGAQPLLARLTQVSQVSEEIERPEIIDYVKDTFIEASKRIKQRTGHTRDLRSEFDHYDVDGNHYLDHQEFGALLVGLGIKLKAAELRLVLQAIDPNEEEQINFETISELLRSNRALDEEQEHQNVISRPDHDGIATANGYDHGGYDDSIKDDKKAEVLLENAGEKTSLEGSLRVYDHQLQRSSEVDTEAVVAPFKQHIRDGSGELEYTQFRRMMHEVGIEDNSVVDALIEEIDKDGSGIIRFDEFARVYDRRIRPSSTVKSEIRSNYDNDGNGKVEHDAFRRKLYEFGIKESRMADELMNESGKDRKVSSKSKESAYVQDQRQLKTTGQESGQASDDGDIQAKLIRTVKAHSRVENAQEVKSLLGELQKKELEFIERVLGRHESIEGAFREFDRDGQNRMNFEHFRDFMRQYGITDEASIAMLLKRLDVDNSGVINLQEFLSVFNAQRLARHTRRVSKSTAQVLRSVESDVRRQNAVSDGRGQHTARPGANFETTREPNEAANVKRVNRLNNAARLRELEEKWIRAALSGHDSVQSVFAAVDQDEDGEINREEFRNLMNQFGIKDEDDVATLMKKLDVDKNGCIEYGEFAAIFHESRVRKAGQSFAVVDSHQSSIAKPVVPSVEPKHGRGARLRDLQSKWMNRVLSSHNSIESAFHRYDENGDGELDHEEFRHFMKRYGIVKDDDINTLIRKFDTDASGTISLEEFSVVFNPLRINSSSTADGISAIAAAAPGEIFNPDELESILEIERELAQRMAHQTRDLRLAFRRFDTNGNGLLEYKEFRSVLRSYRLSEMEIRKVIRHLDRDVSGFINYKEFIAGFGVFKESSGASTGTIAQKKLDKRVLRGKQDIEVKPYLRRALAKPR